MKKCEVTDEMVSRLQGFLARHDVSVDWSIAKAALGVALNPPPEPEIYMSEGMKDAGFQMWNATRSLDAVYLAMERQRLKEQGESFENICRAAPLTGPHVVAEQYRHRRKDDHKLFHGKQCL